MRIKDSLLSVLNSTPQSRKTLTQKLNITDRKLRQAVEELRTDGNWIVNFGSGYYIATTDKEKSEWTALYMARAYKQMKVMKGLNSKVEGQEVMNNVL